MTLTTHLNRFRSVKRSNRLMSWNAWDISTVLFPVLHVFRRNNMASVEEYRDHKQRRHQQQQRQKTIGFMSKTTALHVHRAFLTSAFLWRPLHDYDVIPPNVTFYGGRGHTTTNFSFSMWTWMKPLRTQLQEKSPIERFQIDAIKFERKQIHFFSDVFTVVIVAVA